MPQVYASYPPRVNAAYPPRRAPAYRVRVEPYLDDERKELAERLAAARNNLTDYSQEEAAEKLGVSKPAVSAWETGRNLPDALMLRRLAQLYETTADALLPGGAVSPEAARFSVEYELVRKEARPGLRAVWLAYINDPEHRAAQADTFASAPPRPKTGVSRAVVFAEIASGPPPAAIKKVKHGNRDKDRPLQGKGNH